MYKTLRKCRLEALYGLDSRRIRRRQRMQGIHADEAGAARRHPANQHFQVAKIADAPIVVRAQCIQLHRDSPEPPTGGNRGGSKHFGGETISKQWSAAPPAILRLELVVAGRQVQRQLEAAARDP